VSGSADKARFLKALAFEIRRKRPAEDALTDCIEREGRGGRHKAFRQAASVLQSAGFIAALQAAGLVGDEAASVLATVMAENDHRQLASAINGLADYHDTQGA
jgi:hypothetical protein